MTGPSPYIDHADWVSLLEGNREALYQLYTRYYHTLFFIGLKHTPDAELVKDVIQQQFLYFWESRGSLRVARNVRSYIIISFLRRLTRDWVKARKTVNLEVAWSRKEEEDFSETSAEEKLIRKTNDDSIRKDLALIINALPARQRELIILKFYEGLSYDEIARKTGLTRRTIYNKVHEALLTIKEEALHTSAGTGFISNFLLMAAIISVFFCK